MVVHGLTDLEFMRHISLAIGYGDLLYNVNDPMAHGRTRYPHERFD
jgi:hypothetical protein